MSVYSFARPCPCRGFSSAYAGCMSEVAAAVVAHADAVVYRGGGRCGAEPAPGPSTSPPARRRSRRRRDGAAVGGGVTDPCPARWPARVRRGRRRGRHLPRPGLPGAAGVPDSTAPSAKPALAQAHFVRHARESVARNQARPCAPATHAIARPRRDCMGRRPHRRAARCNALVPQRSPWRSESARLCIARSGKCRHMGDRAREMTVPARARALTHKRRR